MAGVDPVTMALVGAGMGAITSDDPLKGAALGGLGGYAGGSMLGPMMGSAGVAAPASTTAAMGGSSLGAGMAVPGGLSSAYALPGGLSSAGAGAGIWAPSQAALGGAALGGAGGAMAGSGLAQAGALGVPQGLSSGYQLPGGIYSKMAVPQGISAPAGLPAAPAGLDLQKSMQMLRHMPKKKKEQQRINNAPGINPGAGGSFLDIDNRYRQEALSKGGFMPLPSLASRFR